LKWAIEEAKKHNCHISVLYPYRLNQERRNGLNIQSKKELDRMATTRFEDVAEGLLQESKISFDFRSEVGFVQDRIRQFTNKHDVAMLVMGKRMAMENTESLQELIGWLDVPVVMVPQGEPVA